MLNLSEQPPLIPSQFCHAKTVAVQSSLLYEVFQMQVLHCEILQAIGISKSQGKGKQTTPLLQHAHTSLNSFVPSGTEAKFQNDQSGPLYNRNLNQLHVS